MVTMATRFPEEPGAMIEVDNEVDVDNNNDGIMEEDRQDEGSEESQDEATEGDQTPEASSNKRKNPDPSPIWANKCGSVTDDGLKCAFCPKIYKSVNSSTSNLGNHLKMRHGARPEVIKYLKEAEEKKVRIKNRTISKKKKEAERKPPSALNFLVRMPIIDSASKIKIDDAIVKWITTEHKPFNVVEKSSFRRMLFAANPGYICPSARKATKDFDKLAETTKVLLKKEIVKDVVEGEHKTINIVSDHGTSKDRFRTQKNAVTVSRITNQFVMKTDTIAILKCQGSQTGETIRNDVKKELVEIGWENDWTVNWVTDNEKKQRSARQSGRHNDIGLNTNYTGDCVDHTIELVSEESVTAIPDMERSINKCRRFVDYMKDSSKAREAFHDIMVDAGVNPLAIIQGTSNRWFFKWLEASRVLLLWDHVMKFQEDFDLPPTFQFLDEEDLLNLQTYVRCMKPIVEASKLFEGDQFPTASSVIPFLDQITHDLGNLIQEERAGTGRDFATKLLENLKTDRRFSADCFKTKMPYNALTLIDPRYTDLYFEADQKNKAIDDIEIGLDVVYESLRVQVQDQLMPRPVPAEPQVQATNSFAKRRAELKAAKAVNPLQQGREAAPSTFKEKIKEEVEKLSTLAMDETSEVTEDTNPCAWYRKHHKEVPLLAAYFKAHGAFPATSTSAERVFNMDGIVLTRSRTSLDPARQEALIMTGDYLRKRGEGREFTLCSSCPALPSQEARYVLCCQKHNGN